MTTFAPTPTPTDPESRAACRRDAVNRERYALRRAIRESQHDVQERRRELAALGASVDAAKRAIHADSSRLHAGW